MTVQELIAELKTCDQKLEVFFTGKIGLVEVGAVTETRGHATSGGYIQRSVVLSYTHTGLWRYSVRT
jgi:hypothetical protein